MAYILPYRVNFIIQTPDFPDQYFLVSYPFKYKHMTYDTKYMSKNDLVMNVICIVKSMIHHTLDMDLNLKKKTNACALIKLEGCLSGVSYESNSACIVKQYSFKESSAIITLRIDSTGAGVVSGLPS